MPEVVAEVEAEAAAPAAEAAPTVDQMAELERTRIALKAANKESAERRKRLEQLEAAETARAEAEMTETQKLKAALEAAQAETVKAQEQGRETLVRAVFVAEAAKAGAAHPEDVYVLADKTAVSVDEAGKVEGVAEAVKALIDAGRVLVAGRQAQAPNLDGGAGGATASAHSAVKLTAEEIEMARRMGVTPERAAAQKAAMAAERA